MKRIFVKLLVLVSVTAAGAAFAQTQGSSLLDRLGRHRTSLRGNASSARPQQQPQQPQPQQRPQPQSPQPQSPQSQSQPTASGAAAASAKDGGVTSFEFNATPLDLVFVTYGKLIDKTILKDPAILPPKDGITLKPKEGQELTDEEKIFAIETVLEMNGIHIEPYGDTDKFVRAIPRNKIRTEGIPLILDPDNQDFAESTRMVSFMIYLKNISTEEAQKVLEGLKSKDAQLTVFERTQSILVTDTGMNIKRMLELLKEIDVPAKSSGYIRYYCQPKFASCSLIKSAIEEVVNFSKAVQEKESGGKPAPNRPTQPQPTQRPRSFLGRNANNPPDNVNASIETLVNSIADSDRGMIRGEVQVIADEQYSNILIINTLPCNTNIFNEIIEHLDVETTPDTVVKVIRLKYADAEKVENMINDLIGNAPSSKSNSKGNQNQNAKQSASGSTRAQANKSVNQRTGEARTGELSKENTTVLADERINGLVIMTNKELLPTVEKIIEDMDVKLSQVLIETCIVEVGLGHSIKTGMDWVRGLQKSPDGKLYQQAIGGGGGDAKPVSVATNALSALIDGGATALPSIFAPGSAGLNYAVFSDRLDLGAIISLSQSDSTSKYIASPVVMTVDNKEAQIEATQARKFLSNYQSNSSGSYYGSSVVPQYEGKDIGIKIKVKPKINPNGTVMLEVEEEYSQVGAKQEILDPSSSPVQIDTSLTRKMSADVLLDNRQTVVLGGLTDTLTETADTGIPLLKDIPWIGRYLFGKTENKETRSELLVFLTPYVLKDGVEAEAEALRRKQALSDQNAWDDHGWSKSRLADPVKAKELLRRQKQQWKNLDEEHKSQLELEKARQSRVLELEERAIKDSKDEKEFSEELEERRKKVEEKRKEMGEEEKGQGEGPRAKGEGEK